jgi:hypothetical protein
MAVHARTAPARFSGAVVASTMPSDAGVSSAAPVAWITRKAISIPRLVAAPQAAEAKVNNSAPNRNAFWRARASDSRPSSTSSDA